MQDSAIRSIIKRLRAANLAAELDSGKTLADVACFLERHEAGADTAATEGKQQQMTIMETKW